MAVMRVRLIVFDLDETLVHATEATLPCAHTFRVGPYFVCVRPFASALIHFCALHFEIAVWSSSSERYVETVTVDEIIMIDDSPEKLQRQPTRHLYLPSFTGNPLDAELLGVIERIKVMARIQITPA